MASKIRERFPPFDTVIQDAVLDSAEVFATDHGLRTTDQQELFAWKLANLAADCAEYQEWDLGAALLVLAAMRRTELVRPGLMALVHTAKEEIDLGDDSVQFHPDVHEWWQLLSVVRGP